MLEFDSTMYTTEAIRVYGSKKAIADALEISPTAVSQWDEEGLVPPLSAAKLAKRSRGKLKFDPDMYDNWNTRKTS